MRGRTAIFNFLASYISEYLVFWYTKLIFGGKPPATI